MRTLPTVSSPMNTSLTFCECRLSRAASSLRASRRLSGWCGQAKLIGQADSGGVPIEGGAWSTDDGRQLGYARQEREQHVVERDAQRSVSTLQMDSIQSLIGMEVGTLGLVTASTWCQWSNGVRKGWVGTRSFWTMSL
jgi:hypothetical protein